MSQDPLDALAELSIDWAPTPDDVWRRSPFHVDGLHGRVARVIQKGIPSSNGGVSASPLGIAILGQRGSGKTHLLGWVREQVQRDGGYFFLVTLHDGVDFWESVLHCVMDGLLRASDDADSQLRTFLRRLAASIGLPVSLQDAIAGEMRVPPASLEIFISAFRSRWPQLGAECHDTVRALVLRASKNVEALDIGRAYLQAREETEAGERGRWGIQHRGPKHPRWLMRELSQLLALTGPCVIAVDQIDALVAQYGGALVYQTADPVGARDDRQLNMIAGGLMDLREDTARTLCIVACLPQTWELIRKSAVNTAADRFRNVLQLRTIPSPEVGEELVAKRLAMAFQAIGFTPPYPTWPIKPSAFVDAPEYTPRRLLIRVDAHINSCLNAGVVTELARLDESVEEPSRPDSGRRDLTEQQLSVLDERFRDLRQRADVSAALDGASEDQHMPTLLAAGLTAWIEERGPAAKSYSHDPPPRGKPSIHARLRLTLDEDLEDEKHWAFRAIASTNAVAALTRLRDASGYTGIRPGASRRTLIILRKDGSRWSKGEKTREALKLLTEAGGKWIYVDANDLAVFEALRVLRDERHPGLSEWLVRRQPATSTRLLLEALGRPDGPEEGQGDGGRRPQEPDGPAPTGPASTRPPSAASEVQDTSPVSLGSALDQGDTVSVELEAFRKHVAIFAGSGSGKTVLIRRLVEECALRGVSSIVLDPNNDLARLGDRWPVAPDQWGPDDAARAAEYLANTDVVIWTPRRAGGRPISFQPLPDFASIQDDIDELDAAIDAAVATLAPRAKVAGRTAKAERGRAVLREALEYFAGNGHTGLRSYVALLADLPEGVSALDDGAKLAAELSQTLTAAMVNDPLFGGAGAPVDPGVLLTPPPDRRARVSVISFVGLHSDEQRQSFVNQLQMGLFAWIKQHPAGDRPLGGLFVMDEAQTLAPSGAMTACTQSTIALASQARKYGLGLVFATQAPKGLHNRIPGNAASQFIGFLNSEVQISAARAIAQAKGSTVPDISRLRAGQFYFATEGSEFVKIQAPLCLSHHAKSPLSIEEVIGRARTS